MSGLSCPVTQPDPALFRRLAPPSVAAPPGWVWLVLLGLGLVVSGTLAWGVAATRIILPYDEAFVGLTRAEIAAVNGRLPAFMAHDRVSLAGTLLALGVLYAQLAYYGIRRGIGWARRAFVVSSGVGFASFFLFLGFGYLEPLHAAATLVLFVLFVAGLRGWSHPDRVSAAFSGRLTRSNGRAAAPSAGTGFPARQAQIRNGRRIRRMHRGQVLLLLTGGGLAVGGLVIALLGATTVFVPSDLDFLRTTPALLQATNPRLIPLVAHDRATFGGGLVAIGLAVALSAWWGYRPGARWLWWTMVAAGTPGFIATLGVHLAVGYIDVGHLAPALLGLLLYTPALALSYPYLCRAPAPARAPNRNRH